MQNSQMEEFVTEELLWDPKIDNAAIAVSADAGAVTLRGTVHSLRQKREAQRDAQRVYGVNSVKNELEVRMLNKRADADLRGDVLQALMLDSIVPKTVDASVKDGYVTLSGTAQWAFQREEAAFVAANIHGVVSVDNEVDIVPPGPSANDVQHSIKRRWSETRSSMPTT